MSVKKVMLEQDTPFLLLVVYLFYISIQFLMQEFVLTDQVFINSYSGVIASEQLYQIMEVKEKWGWVGSLVIPFLFIPVKVLFTSVAILVGLVLANIEVEFKQLYKVVLVTEFVFILALVIQFVGLAFFVQPQTIEEMNYFAPLTLASIVDISTFPKWVHPLFFGISIYEIFFVVVLTYLLSDKKIGFKALLSPIIITYTVWFIFIYTVILYLSLQFNPS